MNTTKRVLRSALSSCVYLAAALIIGCSEDAILQGSAKPKILKGFADTFTGRFAMKTDILAVIDNSGSMVQEIDAVKDNLDTFHALINSRRLNDYRFAAVTTDAYDNEGQLESAGGVSIVNGTDPDAVAKVEAIIDGINGSPTSGWEQGLKAGQLALMRNGMSFLRDDADLAVIYLSDEQDYSCYVGADPLGRACPGLPNQTQPEQINPQTWTHSPVQGFADYLKGLGRSVLTYTIVGKPDTNCTEQSKGTRYLELQALMGTGFSAPICNDQLAAHFTAIAAQISQRGLCYALSQPVYSAPADIEVTVDGAPIAYNGTTGFQFDATTNAICFAGTYSPPNGSSIVVSYQSFGE